MEKSEYGKTEKNQFFRKITKYTIFLSIIFICTLITKLILFPSQLPVNFDAISYFIIRGYHTFCRAPKDHHRHPAGVAVRQATF